MFRLKIIFISIKLTQRTQRNSHQDNEEKMTENEVKLNGGYRSDLQFENKLVIEIKSVEVLNDIHF